MKPDTRTAMRHLIDQVRAALPFDLPAAQFCSGECRGCSRKLLDFLASELDGWEERLAAGEKPHFGDLSRLADAARKVHRVLWQNGWVPPLSG